MLEIVNEVADKGVAHFFWAPISKMFQDVSLVNVFFLTITLGAQDLEGSELLFIRPGIVSTARIMSFEHQKQD